MAIGGPGLPEEVKFKPEKELPDAGLTNVTVRYLPLAD